MIVGIDTGGTNVDAILFDEDVVATAKVPGDRSDPIERVLDRLPDDVDVSRVVVATTLVLNAAVQERLPACTSVLLPGPGLNPDRAFHGAENHVGDGCIDPRGRVTERPGYDDEPTEPTVAVTAKFGPRNPNLERDVRGTLDRPDESVALGHEAGPGQTFPERAATTVANAKSKETFTAFASDVADALAAAGVDAPVYYLKGDGAMLSGEAMETTPAHALRAGPAASALGLVALSGVEDAVCVDIGGTTTDVTRVVDGFPATERVVAGDVETGYDGVQAVDLPLGGDTRIDAGGLTGRREGNAAAFGGNAPTLTDALYVVGAFEDGAGEADAARAAFERFDDPETVAESAVDTYVERVTAAIAEAAGDASRLVAGGVLAPVLTDRIAATVPEIEAVRVPDHARVAGAVGCAVARVSVGTNVHVDSARGTMTVSAIGTRTQDIKQGRTFEDDEVRTLVIEQAREAAREAGAVAVDEAPVEILDSRRFNVVENSRVAGQVVDATAQIEPGLGRLPGGDR